MKIYDISVLLSNKLVVWPGDKRIEIKRVASIDSGDSCNVSSIEMSAHSGTHIDAPFHFIKDGDCTDSIELGRLMGKCLVIDLEYVTNSEIMVEHIDSYNFSDYKKVLFKTKNSKLWNDNCDVFFTDFISISVDVALYLAKQKIDLVGIDYLSIESFHSKNHDFHKALLNNKIIILEGIDLSGVEAGSYDLVCLPLNLSGCDGAPARAILKEIN